MTAKSDESLSASIMRTLQHGPGSVEELRLEIGHCNHKAIGMALKRLTDAGKTVRLYLLDEQRLGGPRSWVYGLAGVRYEIPVESLKSRVLRALGEAPATNAELACILKHEAHSIGTCISDLRDEGKVKRAGRALSQNPHDGFGAWIYGLGREPKVTVKPKHIPDPAHIAGRTYCPQYSGWGQWR